MEPALLALLVLTVAALAVALAVALLRRGSAGVDLAAPLAPLAQAVTALHVEMRGLSERLLSLEQRQSRVDQGIADGLARAAQDLATLQTYARARQEVEARTAESVRRLEVVIAGAQTKGAAGEQILEAVFARLPAEWQVRNFRVGDKVVEFGLRLPNNLVLPIDSKWSATGLVERLAACEDPDEQRRLKSQIEAVVRGRAKEVGKYLDPSVTVGFGVAAVPDAVHDLCGGLQAELVGSNVVLVSYSLFVPYLLLVFQTTLRTAHQIDRQRLEAYVQAVQRSLAGLKDELDGRLARGITMLQNARDQMTVQLGKVNAGLAGLMPGGAEPVTDGVGQTAPALGDGVAEGR